MISALLSWFQTIFPNDASGYRRKIDIETAFIAFSLFFYMNPIYGTLLGGRQAVVFSQLVFLLIYGITIFVMYRNRQYLFPLARGGGLIWLIVFLPLISTIWSPFPDVTLRRAFAFVNTSLFGVYLGARYSLRDQLYLMRYVFVIVVLLSLIFGLVFPSWGFMQEIHVGAFRGIFVHKNSAAIRLSTGVLVFLVMYISREGNRALNLTGFLITLGMVFASQSSTGIGACLLSFVAIPFFLIPRGKLGQAMPAIFAVLLLVFTCSLFVYYNFSSILEAFGEDSNLTGRSDFWPVILESIYQKFWFGYGYQGYWAGGLNGPSAILAQLASTNSKSHAHNGFLELMLSVGFIGSAAFLFNLWSSILNIVRKLHATKGLPVLFPMLFMVQFFAVNMVETAIYSFNNMTWIVYLSTVTLAARWSMQTDLKGLKRYEPVEPDFQAN